MKAKPYTPEELHKVELAAREYPKGTRETIQRLLATIDQLENPDAHPEGEVCNCPNGGLL